VLIFFSFWSFHARVFVARQHALTAERDTVLFCPSVRPSVCPSITLVLSCSSFTVYLSVASRIRYKLPPVCTLTFDIYHGTALSYMLELCITLHWQSSPLCNPRILYLPEDTPARFTDRPFVAAGLGIWNALPSDYAFQYTIKHLWKSNVLIRLLITRYYCFRQCCRPM